MDNAGQIYMVNIRGVARRAVFAKNSIEAVRIAFAGATGVHPSQVTGFSLLGGNANTRWQFEGGGGR